MLVEIVYGLYLIDLMVLDLNIMSLKDGMFLKYFIFCVIFLLVGINVFC